MTRRELLKTVVASPLLALVPIVPAVKWRHISGEGYYLGAIGNRLIGPTLTEKNLREVFIANQKHNPMYSVQHNGSTTTITFLKDGYINLS